MGDRRRHADESVSVTFTRLMKATTSPWGMLTDPPLVALATGLLVMVVLLARSRGLDARVVVALEVLAALPLVVATVCTVTLSRARARVVDWLASVPFPVENMNAVLNGLGESLEVQFAGEVPPTEKVNAELDRVHPDSFVTESTPELKTIELRIGVVDSKRNPARSNHQRYARVRALVDGVLVPLSGTHPVTGVRVK